MPRVECLNPGCGRLSVYDSYHAKNKPFCSRCELAGRGQKTLAAGVTAFKKNICRNIDGRLGQKCPIPPSVWGQRKQIGDPIKTHVDHIDGNSNNNVPENCQELCDDCHTRKGKMFGDFIRKGHKN